MTTDVALTRAMRKYRNEMAKVKAEQKKVLDTHLNPWLADVGVEITRLRETGFTIDEIGTMLGVKNKTFIYSAMRAAGSETTAPVTTADTDADQDEDGPGYVIEYYDGVVRVILDESEQYDIVLVDGTEPDLPVEWAEHTKERRAVYRDIVKKITTNVKK